MSLPGRGILSLTLLIKTPIKLDFLCCKIDLLLQARRYEPLQEFR
jgi:hypothetical protein